MIRVVVTAPAQEGRLHYRIETPGTRLALPYNGFAADPLEDACAKLRSMGAADEGSMVELFDHPDAPDWTRRMPLGSAQQRTVAEIAERQAYNDEAAISETPAKPKARRRQKRKSPKPPAGKGRVAPKPAKKAKSRQKRKPVKSASRRR